MKTLTLIKMILTVTEMMISQTQVSSTTLSPSHLDATVIGPVKETKSAILNIFEIFHFLFKSFVKVELSYAFTINMFTIAENCTEKLIIV